MHQAEFQGQIERDPRLAAHATSALPAWLWSADGSAILWANRAAAAVFGAGERTNFRQGILVPPIRTAARRRGWPANCPHGAIRMERLRGFGAAPGMLMTCGCSRLDFPDGSHGVLIVATETASR